jgi:ferric-dicitrate binding protein FerR (iron transport regulator)
MPKYRATVHVTGIPGDTANAVRGALEEHLKRSGLENCRVVSVDPEGLPARPVALPNRPSVANENSAWRRQSNGGGLLLVAAAAWAIWFFWWMLSAGAE